MAALTDDPDRVAKILTDSGYAALLGQNPDRVLVESLTSEPEIASSLASIVNNHSGSWQARFLASEFLFRYVDLTLHSRCDRTLLQDSYFQALHHNYTGNGVDWGFGAGPDDVGVLSLTAISFGKDEAFRNGLNDDQPVNMNFFWRIPLHFQPPYRVKDFAALIVARIHALAVDLAGSAEDRDKAIAELKLALAAHTAAPR